MVNVRTSEVSNARAARQIPLPGVHVEPQEGTERTYGAIFTKPWVVNFMLDLCGYVPGEDLGVKVTTEPSCGDGAFLLPVVLRLSQSLRLFGRSLKDAVGAVHAFDLQQAHVDRCRTAVREMLIGEGWPSAEAAKVAESWVHQGDYLLSEVSPSGCDFVVGNPPYIRSEDLPQALRAAYLRSCGTMTPGSDIFVGFIEAALKSLKPQGVLSFICADRWMHNTYGKALRQLVVQDYSVEAVLEMHNVSAFAEDVSAYPAIIQVRRSKQSTVLYGSASSSFSSEAAHRLLGWAKEGAGVSQEDASYWATRLPDWFHTDQVWPTASPKRLALLEELEQRLPLLEDQATDTRIGIGIATGADRVFVTDDRDAVESDRLLPLVTTKHIRSGALHWQDTWLINPWADDGSLVDLSQYPKLAAYFSDRRVELVGRHTARKSSPGSWFRTIDKVNPQLRKQPKLLLQDMKATIQPVYDPGEYYPHHNLYWVTSGRWDMKILGGILLSRVAEMFVEAYGVKMRGRTLRFQAQYLRLIRVPDPSSIEPGTADRLARAFTMRDREEATQAALAAYCLDELPD